MHKAGETLANAVDYVINFTGVGGQSNVIGSRKTNLFWGMGKVQCRLESNV